MDKIEHPKSTKPWTPMEKQNKEQAHFENQWPFQEPIDWRYLPYIRPM